MRPAFCVSMDIAAGMNDTLRVLRTLRVGVISEEYDLQGEIANALLQAGLGFEKEYVLGPGNRVDFLTSDGVAVEVKKGKPNRARLCEQIFRYAGFDSVRGIIIVVETSIKFPIPGEVNGKPCTTLGLRGLWGIAL